MDKNRKFMEKYGDNTFFVQKLIKLSNVEFDDVIFFVFY